MAGIWAGLIADTTLAGHYGHVELALPTFHPLLFNELYRLLRATCFSCKCLRMSKDQKAYFVRILKLLREGRIKDGNNELMSDLGVMPLLHLPTSCLCLSRSSPPCFPRGFHFAARFLSLLLNPTSPPLSPQIIDENLRPADFSSTPFADKDIPDSGSSSKFVNKTSIQQASPPHLSLPLSLSHRSGTKSTATDAC